MLFLEDTSTVRRGECFWQFSYFMILRTLAAKYNISYTLFTDDNIVSGDKIAKADVQCSYVFFCSRDGLNQLSSSARSGYKLLIFP